MVTIQLVSEDFSAQELMAYLEEQHATHEAEVSIVSAHKEGLSFVQDVIQFVFSEETGRAMAEEIVKQAMLFAAKKALEYAFPDPHIFVKFSNGQHKKIFYKGKSDATIVRELMADLEDGQVVKVMFKS